MATSAPIAGGVDLPPPSSSPSSSPKKNLADHFFDLLAPEFREDYGGKKAGKKAAPCPPAAQSSADSSPASSAGAKMAETPAAATAPTASSASSGGGGVVRTISQVRSQSGRGGGGGVRFVSPNPAAGDGGDPSSPLTVFSSPDRQRRQGGPSFVSPDYGPTPTDTRRMRGMEVGGECDDISPVSPLSGGAPTPSSGEGKEMGRSGRGRGYSNRIGGGGAAFDGAEGLPVRSLDLGYGTLSEEAEANVVEGADDDDDDDGHGYDYDYDSGADDDDDDDDGAGASASVGADDFLALQTKRFQSMKTLERLTKEEEADAGARAQPSLISASVPLLAIAAEDDEEGLEGSGGRSIGSSSGAPLDDSLMDIDSCSSADGSSPVRDGDGATAGDGPPVEDSLMDVDSGSDMSDDDDDGLGGLGGRPSLYAIAPSPGRDTAGAGAAAPAAGEQEPARPRQFHRTLGNFTVRQAPTSPHSFLPDPAFVPLKAGSGGDGSPSRRTLGSMGKFSFAFTSATAAGMTSATGGSGAAEEGSRPSHSEALTAVASVSDASSGEEGATSKKMKATKEKSQRWIKGLGGKKPKGKNLISRMKKVVAAKDGESGLDGCASSSAADGLSDGDGDSYVDPYEEEDEDDLACPVDLQMPGIGMGGAPKAPATSRALVVAAPSSTDHYKAHQTRPDLSKLRDPEKPRRKIATFSMWYDDDEVLADQGVDGRAQNGSAVVEDDDLPVVGINKPNKVSPVDASSDASGPFAFLSHKKKKPKKLMSFLLKKRTKGSRAAVVYDSEEERDGSSIGSDESGDGKSDSSRVGIARPTGCLYDEDEDAYGGGRDGFMDQGVDHFMSNLETGMLSGFMTGRAPESWNKAVKCVERTLHKYTSEGEPTPPRRTLMSPNKPCGAHTTTYSLKSLQEIGEYCPGVTKSKVYRLGGSGGRKKKGSASAGTGPETETMSPPITGSGAAPLALLEGGNASDLRVSNSLMMNSLQFSALLHDNYNGPVHEDNDDDEIDQVPSGALIEYGGPSTALVPLGKSSSRALVIPGMPHLKTSKAAAPSCRSIMVTGENSLTVVSEERAMVAATSKVFVLLLEPRRRLFELIQLEYYPSVATIGDLVGLIPSKATERLLGYQIYVGLCRPKIDGPASVMTDLEMKASGTSNGGSANIYRGEILVAIPEGYTGEECAKMANTILSNKEMCKLMKKKNPLAPDTLLDS